VDNSDESITLYEGYCPSEQSDILNLKWNNYTSFEFNIFRINNAKQLTVVCVVDTFANAYDNYDESGNYPLCNRMIKNETMRNETIKSQLEITTVSSTNNAVINGILYATLLIIWAIL